LSEVLFEPAPTDVDQNTQHRIAAQG